MNDMELNLIKDILYSENDIEAQCAIAKLDNPEILHIIADNYNWDDGFQLPAIIINNKHCDLGTALMIFYLADGYSFLDSNEENISESLKEWYEFTSNLFIRIKEDSFKSKNIYYRPELTKVQIYKLTKQKPDIPQIFFTGTDVNKININLI